MASQLFVPGPAQIYVGTGGNLTTRVVFAGGGGGGASGFVTVGTPRGDITGYSISKSAQDYGGYQPNAIYVGGGWGAAHRGVVSSVENAGTQVTGIESIPGYYQIGNNFGAGGFGYIGSDGSWNNPGGGWQFLGFSKTGVQVNPVTMYQPVMADFTSDAPAGMGYIGKTATIEIPMNRYVEAVLERALKRCNPGSPGGSTSGWIEGKANSIYGLYDPLGIGALVQQTMLFVPLAIVSPYATAKSQYYSAIHKGIHFPCATISTENCNYSIRARTHTLVFQCHWVACRITGAGILYDYNVAQCLDVGPS